MAESNLNSMVESLMMKLKELVETETIIGKPIDAKEGTIIIPISKVSFGFGLGGSDGEQPKQKSGVQLGSGAGGSLTPIGFLVVDEQGVRILEVGNSSQLDGLICLIPELYEKLSSIISKKREAKKEKKQEAPCEEGSCG